MSFFKLDKKKDRFEIYLFGNKIVLYRYLRMIREIFLMLHYNQLKETLKTKFNIALPKEAYHHLSGDVELIELPLKEIRVPCGHRKTCSIPETGLYKFLVSGGKTNYCYRLSNYYSEANIFIPVDKKDTARRIRKLTQSLTKAQAYDPSKGIITLRKNNALIDGQHRAVILYYKYGGDHKVLVARER